LADQPKWGDIAYRDFNYLCPENLQKLKILSNFSLEFCDRNGKDVTLQLLGDQHFQIAEAKGEQGVQRICQTVIESRVLILNPDALSCLNPQTCHKWQALIFRQVGEPT